MMKFDFIIGNPPYQGESENNVRKPPVYHLFMDTAKSISDVVELITPGRFLFDAGQTPKEWNQKMLNDEHFKVLHYESDGSKIFPNTEIKGGIAITIRNKHVSYGKIKVFTSYEELNKILHKIFVDINTVIGLDTIVASRGHYRLSNKFFIDYPEAPSALGDGTGNMIVSNIFDKLPEVFVSAPISVDTDYYRVLGRTDNDRVYRYIKKEYVLNDECTTTFNAIVPKSSGSGVFGETFSVPVISKPNEITTDTFISIGKMASEFEVQALCKYINSKFARTMLGVKKVTQDNARSVWQYVPLQDFTENSDIDWTVSVSDIDKQLYKKYGLSDDEIKFIETHVKEMV